MDQHSGDQSGGPRERPAAAPDDALQNMSESESGYGTDELRFEIRVGYRVSEPLWVGLQFLNLRRRIDVVAQANQGVPEHVPGTIQDQLQSIELGIGYQR